MLYSDFCKYAPQRRQMSYEAMTKQMYKVHRHHFEQKYISKVSYLSTRTNPPDWWMIYEPGERARREYDFSQGNFALEPRGSYVPGAAASAAFTETHFGAAETSSAGNLSENELSLFKKLADLGVKDKVALELVTQYPERVREQIEALPFRPIKKSVSGYLIKAIRENYSLPLPLLSDVVKSETAGSGETAAEANSSLEAETEQIQKQIRSQLEFLVKGFENLQNTVVVHRELQFAAKTIWQSLNLLLDEAKGSSSIIYEEVEERLGKLEKLLDDSLLPLADEEVKQEVDTALKSYRAKMLPEKVEESVKTMTLSALRRKYSVPRLSLFSDF
jgi:hypothetical protein